MESVEAKIDKKTQRIRYIIETRVFDIKPSNLSGWWIHFEGSRESLHFEGDKPFEIGQSVKITFEGIPNAQPR